MARERGYVFKTDRGGEVVVASGGVVSKFSLSDDPERLRPHLALTFRRLENQAAILSPGLYAVTIYSGKHGDVNIRRLTSACKEAERLRKTEESRRTYVPSASFQTKAETMVRTNQARLWVETSGLRDILDGWCAAAEAKPKTAAQLDAEIAEALAEGPEPF